MADKELQIQEKQDVRTTAESTSGGPMFVPSADIYEDNDAINVQVDMPGVEKDALTINLEDNNLSLYGRVTRPEFESKTVYSEYRTGDFSRSFMIPDVIDQTKIDATMKNGVLHLRLPKAEHAKPHRIEVKAA